MTGVTAARRTPPGIRGAITLMLLAFTPMLAACGNGGFNPVYGSLGVANDNAVEAKLRQIDISPIPGRVGQRIRNELIFGTTGGDNADTPAYRLEIAVRETITSTIVARTGDSASNVYNIDATFRLIDIKTKEIVLKGTSFSRAGFERFKSIFSNVRARKDAEDRAAKVVATDLKSRLAAYLAAPA